MTPSTSKPAKLLTSLWIRLSCGGGGRVRARGRHAEEEEGRARRKRGGSKAIKTRFTPLLEAIP